MRALLQRMLGDYKSPRRVRDKNLLRSRNNKTVACHELRRELEVKEREIARCHKVIERKDREIEKLREDFDRLASRRVPTTCVLPEDPPIETHGYGARMVCLAVELAKVVGLRATERVIKVMFQWLEVNQDVPDFTTVRNWLIRLGVAAISEPIEPADDWVWLADHSNQIGPEKALVVLGLRSSNLPPPGTPLTHGDVRVLLVEPAANWRKEDVANTLRELVEKHCPPRAALMDNGADLVGGVKILQNEGESAILLHDFKHKAANIFKAMFVKDPRFCEFTRMVGQTRSAIQQTELAHLTPPTVKQKARFMNMAPTLRWALMILWLLDHPEARSRKFMTDQRLEEKLGWLREFAEELSEWSECQAVIDVGLKLIAEEGLHEGASARLGELVLEQLSFASSRNLASQLIEFVSSSEGKLRPGERLPMSTEILESSFALYKQLERQHSRGGFTSLLAAFGALLTTHTPDSVRRQLRRISTKAAREWVAEHLGPTLVSKRRQTSQEYQTSATKVITAT